MDRIKELANSTANNLKLVHRLRDFSKGKDKDVTDIINEAADRIEKLTADMLYLYDEVNKK